MICLETLVSTSKQDHPMDLMRQTLETSVTFFQLSLEAIQCPVAEALVDSVKAKPVKTFRFSGVQFL